MEFDFERLKQIDEEKKEVNSVWLSHQLGVSIVITEGCGVHFYKNEYSPNVEITLQGSLQPCHEVAAKYGMSLHMHKYQVENYNREASLHQRIMASVTVKEND